MPANEFKTVAHLVKALKRLNQDALIRVGMWYGPGSPEIELFDLERVGQIDPNNSDGRYSGPHIVYLAGSDTEQRSADSRRRSWEGS